MQSLTISPAYQAANPKSSAVERFAAAFTKQEYQLFLSGNRLDDFTLGELRIFHPEEGKLWIDFLTEFQPTVLLSAWSTPPIPMAFINSRHFSLRYICHITGTIKHLVPRELMQRGILVSNWGVLAAEAVAEHALLLTLSCLRQAPRWPDLMNISDDTELIAARYNLNTASLYGRRVGLHGFGNIAREMVQILKPFRVHCSAYSIGVPHDYIRLHGVEPCSSLEELFSNCDILIECEALTPKTIGTVTEKILRLLPHDAVFVNVGRGQTVDEVALAKLAEEGHLRVGCDVFMAEPLASDSPLRRAKTGVFTPHLGAPTNDGFAKLGDFAMQNLRRYTKGDSPAAIVTLEMYDRST